ncbi:hypothetical protein BpHYR1_005844 [Brachionus plicatilis]|uniref:Uncharacterized protein n=1 Tax=Brachionus plicatilis TaxID=10195 RepID=A0A3M7SDU1_BRAPC|nr:hypothetical protein BpHYR1_005844 [Brachionus plicatilis]
MQKGSILHFCLSNYNLRNKSLKPILLLLNKIETKLLSVSNLLKSNPLPTIDTFPPKVALFKI